MSILSGFLNNAFSIILFIRKSIENTGLSAGFSMVFLGLGSCMILLYFMNVMSEKRDELDQKEQQPDQEKSAKKRNTRPLWCGLILILCKFIFV